jgi:hypothetical protein
MALTAVDPGLPPLPAKEDLPPPPKVAITPCDPWPRPYYLEEGLRRVKPYHFTYNTNAKERWRDREVLDVFSSEFRDREAEYYVCFQVSWTIRDSFFETRRSANALCCLEKCHSHGRHRHQWKTDPFAVHHHQEWRCHQSYHPSTRTPRVFAVYWNYS